MRRKYEELLNKRKADQLIEHAGARTITNPALDEIRVEKNRFKSLLMTSSSESSDSLDQDAKSSDALDQDTLETPKSSNGNDKSIYQRYANMRSIAKESLSNDERSNSIVENNFCFPGDSIYRRYWRYTILRSGEINCCNASSNRRKISQVIIKSTNKPFEYINDIPVSNYFAMFRGASNLHHICFTGVNFSIVTSLGRMFSDCYQLRSVDMSNLNLSKVSDYQHMFDNCCELRSVDFSGSNMKGAVRLDSMFYGCHSISIITLTNLNGENVKYMNHMFRDCKALRILELPSLQLNGNIEMKKMFCGANQSIDIICPDEKIQERYQYDKQHENESSSDSLNRDAQSPDSPDNLNDIPENAVEKEPIKRFPHVLTKEQRESRFKWSLPPENIIPTWDPSDK